MNPQLQPMLQQAIQAFQSGNFDAADSILKRLIQVDAKNLPALHVLGLIKASQEKYKEAADLLSRAARLNPGDVSIQYNLAKALMDCGLIRESISHHKKAVELAPGNSEAWLNYGKAASGLKDLEHALAHYNQAIKLKPDFAEAWCNKANVLRELKKNNEALAHFDQAIKLKPDYLAAWSNKAAYLQELGMFDEAIAHYDQVIKLKPDLFEAWSNRGGSLHCLKRYEEALTYYDQAIQLNPEYVEAWNNKGLTLAELKRYEEAFAHYDQAIQLNSGYVDAWYNKGNALRDINQYEQSIACYDQVLNLRPLYTEAWSNKGTIFQVLKRYEEAIASFDRAIKINPDFPGVWLNKGSVLSILKIYDEAINHYYQALNLKPDMDWALGSYIFTKMGIAKWDGLKKSLEDIFEKVHSHKRVIQPFEILALSDDEVLHKKCAETYAEDKLLFNPALGAIAKRNKTDKIRIGYFSADFKSHPVAFLTAELFEIHDRSTFEVFAFSLSKPEEKDRMSERLMKAFDHFLVVDDKSNIEIAGLCRELGIDIAIDLSGYTEGSRTGIFAYRAAPIQINYLGFPGTLAVDYMDYIIADRTVIPESSIKYFTEKVIYLPHTYMVDDTSRKPSPRIFTRKECGIPDDVFVYCCFNNSYKFNEQILDSWSRILQAVDNSVLWISENNIQFRKNIIAEFEKRKVSSSRIIFAPKLDSIYDHLARIRLADVFLDTDIYNAHTTALDSLKVGVPVITRRGNSFAGRVAASLLAAIDLAELITLTSIEYEDLAIDLGSNTQKLENIRRKLAVNCNNSPLFNTKLFAKNIESAYIKIYERYQSDIAPDHILID